MARSHKQCPFLPQTGGPNPSTAPSAATGLRPLWPQRPAVSHVLLLLPALLLPWVSTALPFLLPTGGVVWLNQSSTAAGIYL